MADPLPLETPFVQYPSPQILDHLLVETIDPRKPGYTPLQVGAPHPNVKSWPDHRLVKPEVISIDKVVRYWANDPVGQSFYNYDQLFSGEDAEKSIFVRRYLYRRDVYAVTGPATKATPFTGVYLIALSSGGSGYNPAVPPLVTVDGDGTGATAVATVTASGEVSYVTLTSEGSGYSSASVSFSSSQGSGATATAVLQSSSCVLIKEQANELPADDPRRSLYVMVTRVFETLPGPTLRQVDFIPRIRKYADILKTIVLTSSVPADPNATFTNNGTIIEYQPLPDRYRTLKIESSIGSTPPETYTYYATVSYRFPDELDSITLVYRGTLNGTAFSYGMGVVTSITDGYGGPCRARISEHHTYTPDETFFNSLPQVTPVYPKRGSIVATVQYAAGNGAHADVATFAIPETLHGNIGIAVDSIMPGGSIGGTSGLSATVPTSIPKGSWIVKDVIPEQLEGFGLWIYRVIEVQKPNI